MNLPTYDQFISPLLMVLQEAPEGLRAREAQDQVAARVGLTPEHREQELPTGKSRFRNRISWAHDRLKRGRFCASPRRGQWMLTEAGKRLAAEHPKGLPDPLVRSIANADKGSTVPKPTDPETPPLPLDPVDLRSPEERIDDALIELNVSVAHELLEAITQSSPEFFERMVLDLLLGLGYGTQRDDLQHTGRGGDGGIDGIISLDPLGLEKVYVQAKRWTSGTVGRPEIQGFFGALAGRRAAKGVFITTSSFTRDASEYAAQVSDSIVLIDGDRLTALMIENGIGVSVQRSIRLVRVDSDYFED